MALNLQIDGEPSGAIAAVKAAQAAIDSLHGKTVTVHVNVDKAVADLDALNGANGVGAASARGLGAAHDNASNSVREHARANGDAAHAVRDSARANDHASDSVRSSAAAVDRATSSSRARVAAVERETAALRGLGVESDRTLQRSTLLNRVLDAGTSAARATAAARAAAVAAGGGDPTSVFGRVLAAGVGGARETIAEQRAVAAATDSVAAAQTRAAAAGQEYQTAAAAYHRAYSDFYGAASGTAAQRADAATAATRSERVAMDESHSSYRRATADHRDLASTFGEVVGAAARAGESLSSAGLPALLLAGAAGIATAGIGILTAATAAVGLAGFAAVGGLSEVKNMVEKTFARVEATGRGAVRSAGAFRDLKASTKGLAEAMQTIGEDSTDPVLRGMDSLTQGATRLAKNLAPAIAPAIQGITDLSNAAMSALGSPEAVAAYVSFAKTVSENAPGLGQGLQSLITGSGAVGETLVGVLGQFGAHGTRLGAAAGGDPIAGLGPLGQSIKGLLTGAGGMAASVLPGIASGARSVAEALGPAGRAVVGFGAAVIGAGSLAGPALVGLGQQAVSAVAPVAQALGGAGRAVVGFGAAVLTAGASAGPAIVGLARSVGQGATSLASRVVNVASSAAAGAGSAIGGALGGGVGGGITRTVTKTATTVVKWVQKVIDQGLQVGSAAGSAIGAAIGGGVGPGITRTITKTITTIIKWVERIIDAGASALGIKSPSRVFMAMGQNIAEGMAVGISGHSSAAVAATKQMTAQVIAGSQGVLGGTRTAPAAAPVAAPVAAPAPTPSSGLWSQAAAAYRDLTQNVRATADAHTAAAQRAEDHRAAVQRLTSLGYSPKAAEALATKNDARAAAAAERDKARADRRDSARWRAEHGLADSQGITEDAKKWRAEQGRRDQRDALRQGRDTQWQGAGPRPPAPGSRPQPPSAGLAGLGGFAKATWGFLFGSTDPFGPNLAKALDGGNKIGQALGQGLSKGIGDTAVHPLQAASNMVTGMVDWTKKKLRIFSPSGVFHDIGTQVGAGLTLGLGAAVSSGSDGVRGIASDRGLQVGYLWGRSVITGADVVMQKAALQGVSLPQIESPQAKAALGALGLLGPAGSGAQIWKTPMVTLSPATSASRGPSKFEFHLNIDGDPVRVIATQVVEQAFDDLASSIPRQVG